MGIGLRSGDYQYLADSGKTGFFTLQMPTNTSPRLMDLDSRSSSGEGLAWHCKLTSFPVSRRPSFEFGCIPWNVNSQDVLQFFPAHSWQAESETAQFFTKAHLFCKGLDW